MLLQKLRNQFEGELLDSITDPLTTLFIMVTVKVLSMHAADEEYLTKEEHNYIKVCPWPAQICFYHESPTPFSIREHSGTDSVSVPMTHCVCQLVSTAGAKFVMLLLLLLWALV